MNRTPTTTLITKQILDKEGGSHLEQESNRQKTMEDIDGGLHPAVDGQSLGEW